MPELPPRASLVNLRLLWRDVTTGMEKADTDETTVIAMRNITWRSKESSLQDWMPALVSLFISRAAGKVAAALLQKQLELRQLWMVHGGPIFTVDGNRRKRRYVGDIPESISELRNDVERLRKLYAKIANGREGDVVTAMVAASGQIISGDDLGIPSDRRAARLSLKYTFGKRSWLSGLPKLDGIHAPPFGRRIR